MFNAVNDCETLVSPAGYLPTAGSAFSEKFRKLHRGFIHQYQHKPLGNSLATHYVKTFQSDLYSNRVSEYSLCTTYIVSQILAHNINIIDKNIFTELP